MNACDCVFTSHSMNILQNRMGKMTHDELKFLSLLGPVTMDHALKESNGPAIVSPSSILLNNSKNLSGAENIGPPLIAKSSKGGAWKTKNKFGSVTPALCVPYRIQDTCNLSTRILFYPCKWMYSKYLRYLVAGYNEWSGKTLERCRKRTRSLFLSFTKAGKGKIKIKASLKTTTTFYSVSS